MPYLTKEKLSSLGLLAVGENVLISDAAQIHNPAKISLGSNVRIDDFCVLSAGQGGIDIGSHVHLGCFCSLIGAEKISLGDYSGLSARVSIFSSSDDYSGEAMTNPTVPAALRKVRSGRVLIGRHVVVGAGAVILPGVSIGDSAAIGALTLVARNVMNSTISLGVPARRVGMRAGGHLALEKCMEVK